jgi:hypothetical protein
MIDAFRAPLSEESKKEFGNLLTIIGAALPMDAIFADLAGTPENVKTVVLSDALLRQLLEVTYSGLIAKGISKDLLPEMLHVVEPFRSNWDATEAILATLVRS